MRNYILLLLAFVTNTAFAQTPQPEDLQTEKYSRVKIFADVPGIIRLAEAGVAMDHGEMKQGFWYISDFSETEIAIVRSQGFSYEVLIDDVKQYYKDQNKPDFQKNETMPVTTMSIGCSTPPVYATPANFTLGSMGGFYTYAEVLWHMDNLATLFPTLVKARTAIGPITTVNGNSLFWMKISDNPNVDEAEPEVLYNSAHHAREPASVSQLIMYMYYLCENYATDPEVQYLVDNEEMYFVPLVNPDGYIRNETTDPAGGGLWRKNRRNNGGSFGVDINRNYGYQWGYDNIGSSPFGSSESYRGTAAWSEAESQNLRDFTNTRSFKLSLNNHTFGNLLIYSFGYDAAVIAPDYAQFSEYARHLTTYNKYSYGTAPQTVLYSTNGTIDDWQYGDVSIRPKIFGMTPEAGRSDEGFWPPSTRIIDICKENIWQNLHTAHLALKFAVASDDEPNYIPAATGFFNFKVLRLGMEAPATYTVSIVPIGTEISSVGAAKTFSTLNLLDEVSDSIAFTLNPLAVGTTFKYELRISNGAYTFKDTIVKRFGPPVTVFSSDGNSMTGWTGSGWGLSTSVFHSGTASITDSPTGDYNDNVTSTISTVSNLNLTDAISAQIVFWTRWEIETNYDYAQVVASSDGGITWDPLCGHHTKSGNGYQDFGNPVYDAYKFNWMREEISLDAYAGMNIKIGFKLVTDNGGNADGFYFDDLKVEKLIPASTGIKDQHFTGIQVSVPMPNPATDYTYINYDILQGSDGIVSVYNSLGQLMLTEKLDAAVKNHRLNISAFPQGVYYYNVSAGNKSSETRRLSVVR